MRTSAWWRSNRLWVLLAIPALTLALAASSFRLSALYLRWEWSQPTLLRGPGTYTQTLHRGHAHAPAHRAGWCRGRQPNRPGGR